MHLLKGRQLDVHSIYLQVICNENLLAFGRGKPSRMFTPGIELEPAAMGDQNVHLCATRTAHMQRFEML